MTTMARDTVAPQRKSGGPSGLSRPSRRRGRWQGWMFVGPFMGVFALTFLAPVAYALYLSLFRDRLIGGVSFVGLSNYAQALADPKLHEGALRVGLFLVVQVPIMLGLALVAALALDSPRLAGRALFRIGLFLPYAVPGVVAVLMWGYIYSPRMGLLADLNAALGLGADPFSAQWILVAIGNIVTWEFLGYNMLIFYSALSSIPLERYEAAALDGAGPLRTVWSIKLPALRGAIVIATIFSIIGSFQLFNEPNILRSFAPSLITTFYTPNMYAYNLSFFGQQVNYAATVAIVMGVITAVIAYIVQLRGSREDLR
ncbi:multiple sugar transport system permease protein [Kineosphaera limosa]|nr:multiple sugar transport system permease protein [Kineosphaera limosa]